MSKLTRFTHKIFGISATFASQMGKYGSLKNGSAQYAADAEEVQSTANWLVGLYDSIIGNNSPAIQDINGVYHHASRQIGYLMQAGIAEYDAGTVYYIGSLCNVDGVMYKSLIDDNENNTPSSSPLLWQNITGTILNTHKLPSESDFPNSVNLYGWNINGIGDYDDGEWIGAKALTENGSIDSVQAGAGVNDVLGDDTYCYFDGANDYLSSSDPAFDSMVGSFSACGWFRADTWTSGSSYTLISKTDTVNGWSIGVNNAGDLTVYNYTQAATAVLDYSGDNIRIPDGWHHVAMVRNDGIGTYIYVDGMCVGYTDSHFNIVDAGNLEIGSRNGGTLKFTGAAQYIAVDTDTAWTPNEVRKIYSSQCQNFSVQGGASAGGKVSILDGRGITGSTKHRITSTYNLTNSWADVGLTVRTWESGRYKVTAEFTVYSYDSTGAVASPYVRIVNGGNAINGAVKTTKSQLLGSNSEYNYIPTTLTFEGYFEKDENIDLQAYMSSGSGSNIFYSSGSSEPVMTLEKLD